MNKMNNIGASCRVQGARYRGLGVQENIGTSSPPPEGLGVGYKLKV
jgi:hypothetical protein